MFRRVQFDYTVFRTGLYVRLVHVCRRLCSFLIIACVALGRTRDL